MNEMKFYFDEYNDIWYFKEGNFYHYDTFNESWWLWIVSDPLKEFTFRPLTELDILLNSPAIEEAKNIEDL